MNWSFSLNIEQNEHAKDEEGQVLKALKNTKTI